MAKKLTSISSEYIQGKLDEGHTNSERYLANLVKNNVQIQKAYISVLNDYRDKIIKLIDSLDGSISTQNELDQFCKNARFIYEGTIPNGFTHCEKGSRKSHKHINFVKKEIKKVQQSILDEFKLPTSPDLPQDDTQKSLLIKELRGRYEYKNLPEFFDERIKVFTAFFLESFYELLENDVFDKRVSQEHLGFIVRLFNDLHKHILNELKDIDKNGDFSFGAIQERYRSIDLVTIYEKRKFELCGEDETKEKIFSNFSREILPALELIGSAEDLEDFLQQTNDEEKVIDITSLRSRFVRMDPKNILDQEKETIENMLDAGEENESIVQALNSLYFGGLKIRNTDTIIAYLRERPEKPTAVTLRPELQYLLKKNANDAVQKLARSNILSAREGQATDTDTQKKAGATDSDLDTSVVSSTVGDANNENREKTLIEPEQGPVDKETDSTVVVSSSRPVIKYEEDDAPTDVLLRDIPEKKEQSPEPISHVPEIIPQEVPALSTPVENNNGGKYADTFSAIRELRTGLEEELQSVGVLEQMLEFRNRLLDKVKEHMLNTEVCSDRYTELANALTQYSDIFQEMLREASSIKESLENSRLSIQPMLKGNQHSEEGDELIKKHLLDVEKYHELKHLHAKRLAAFSKVSREVEQLYSDMQRSKEFLINGLQKQLCDIDPETFLGMPITVVHDEKIDLEGLLVLARTVSATERELINELQGTGTTEAFVGSLRKHLGIKGAKETKIVSQAKPAVKDTTQNASRSLTETEGVQASILSSISTDKVQKLTNILGEFTDEELKIIQVLHGVAPKPTKGISYGKGLKGIVKFTNLVYGEQSPFLRMQENQATVMLGHFLDRYADLSFDEPSSRPPNTQTRSQSDHLIIRWKMRNNLPVYLLPNDSIAVLEQFRTDTHLTEEQMEIIKTERERERENTKTKQAASRKSGKMNISYG